jgi:hypothetical protein
MRTSSAALLSVWIAIPLAAWAGCGNSSTAEDLFNQGQAGAATGGGGGEQDASAGGTAGTGETGGSGGAGVGGSGGTPPTGGYGGTLQTGGYGGTPQTGGYGGTLQTGGYGGTPQTGGYGATPQTGGYGGTGGTPQTGGNGGGPPPLREVPCPTDDPSDDDACQVPGQVCCLTFQDFESGACLAASQAPFCETDIACHAPADCPPNTVCCGRVVKINGTWRYDSVRCQPSCDGSDNVLFCDPYDNTISCTGNQWCKPSSILPDGYYVCRS